MTYGIIPDWYHGEKHVSVNGYATDVITQDAVDFLRQQKTNEKPFFLYLSYNAPHFGKGWSPAEEKTVNIMQPQASELKRVSFIEDKIRREFADIIQRILKSGFESSRFAERQQHKYATESLSRERYRLLRAYADVVRKIRTQVVARALEQYPNLSNTELRAVLEDRFGNGSFEPTRFSDTRINKLRQAEMIVSRSTHN